MDLKPLFSRIIVKRKEVEKVGSIIIPVNSQQMKATEGEVVAIGSEVDTVKVGEVVFFGKYSGAELERNGEKYVLMNEEDVLCLVAKGVENA